MIAVVIPVLGRPEAVLRVADSLEHMTHGAYRLFFLCSPGDDAAIEAVERTGADYRVVMWHPDKADFAMKTNLGFRLTNEPYVFLGATDLRFHVSWDLHVLLVAQETGAGVIGTDDMGNPLVRRGKHATHALVRRTYIEECGGTFDEEPGVVYAECYDHQCVDNELVFVAQERGQWAFAANSKVEHLHPLWRKGTMDPVYQKALARGQADIRIFASRRADWTARRGRTKVGA
ncbi:MAG: hypothetical protein K0S82_68 [Gaiellaceae bacterium]|jgi:hypothetical protein|nr:hypothetical protein [Gaiellaceae bacterium]